MNIQNTNCRLKQILLAGTVLFLFSLISNAAPPRRVAMSIGIGNYTEYPALNAAAGDAHAIGNTLLNRGFDSITTITNDEVSLLSLHRNLETLSAGLGQDDLLVIYVAAHGWVDRDGGTARILPSNTRRGSEREDGIDLAAIVDNFSQRTDARIIVMLDACFAGAFTIADAGGRLTFWAGARANEWALEDRENGLFTGQLLKYLNGKNRTDLANRVIEGVIRETGGWQVPSLNSNHSTAALAML